MGFIHNTITPDSQSTRIHSSLIDTMGKLYVLTCPASMTTEQKARKLSQVTGLDKNRMYQFVVELSELERLVIKLMQQLAYEVQPTETTVDQAYLDANPGTTLQLGDTYMTEGTHTPEIMNISELLNWVIIITNRDYNTLFTSGGQLDPVYDITDLSELVPAITLAVNLIVKTFNSTGKQEPFDTVTQQEFDAYKTYWYNQLS